MTTVACGAFCAGVGSAQAQFNQTDLASDVQGLAKITDPNLVNTWGLTAMPAGASPFWIANRSTATSSVYSVSGSTTVAPVDLPPPVPPLTNFVNMPTVTGPTGIVANSGTSFGIAGGSAAFIFANLNGSISAWNLSTGGTAVVVSPASTAAYTGLAINPGTSTTPAMLYAANGRGGGSIDVFNSSFGRVTNLPPSAFVDPDLPAGYVPFNVEDIGGKVYVTYALAGPPTQEMATGGEGAVAVFDEDGGFIQQLVGVSSSGKLASPWGMAIAPAGFGAFGGDLLVGNFSVAAGVADQINAFNVTTGAFEGAITVDPGGPAPGALWDLMFGGGGAAGDPMTLYFTDGIDEQAHGLFGAISVPEPSIWAMMLVGFGSLGLFAARRRRGVAIGD